MIKRIAAMLALIPVCGILASTALIVPLLAGGVAMVWAVVGGGVGVMGLAVLERRRAMPTALGVALALLLAAFGAGGGMLANAIKVGEAGNTPDPTTAAIIAVSLALVLAARRRPTTPVQGAGVTLGFATTLTLILSTSGAAILPAALLFGALAGSIVLAGAAAHIVTSNRAV